MLENWLSKSCREIVSRKRSYRKIDGHHIHHTHNKRLRCLHAVFDLLELNIFTHFWKSASRTIYANKIGTNTLILDAEAWLVAIWLPCLDVGLVI